MLMKPEWTEWNESRVVLRELPQCEPVFHKFLEYLYTGKIIITHTNVMGILCLADKYIVKVSNNLFSPAGKVVSFTENSTLYNTNEKRFFR